MAVSGVAVTVTFGVWDTLANTWKTGDAANLTMRVVADGAEATPTAGAVEIDATNAPGQYKLALTAGENTGTDLSLQGKSSTSGCIVIPATWQNQDAAITSRAATGEAAAALVAYDPPTDAEMDAGFAAISIPTVEEINTELEVHHGAGLWGESGGVGGACTVNGTLKAAGVGCPQVDFVIKAVPGGALQAYGSTDENGEFIVQLELGTYGVYFGPDSRYEFTVPESLVVTVDGQTVDYTCTAGVYPTQGMTYAQLRAAVYYALHHLAGTYGEIDPEHVATLVRQAHYQVDADLQWTCTRAQIKSVASQRRYVLEGNVRDILALAYDGTELPRVTVEEDIFRQELDDTIGTPTAWSWWGRELSLYQTPNASDHDIDLWVLETPDALTGDTNRPSLPPHTHTLIVQKALQMAYEHAADVEHVAAYNALYLQSIERERSSRASVHGGAKRVRRDEKVV